MTDEEFREILRYLELSWQGYRKVRKGIKRRLSKHIKMNSFQTVGKYLTSMQQNTNLRGQCRLFLTVPISRFFRHQQVWIDLESEILPALIQAKPHCIKVWSAGCAGGEEVYSFNIIWNRLKKRYIDLPDLKLTATDMNPLYIQRAQSAVYTRSSLYEISKEEIPEYFIKVDENTFEMKSTFKKNIELILHNFEDPPPGNEYDIVFLRNSLLTYYQTARTEFVFSNIISALVTGGLIIIGSHENMPETYSHLKPISQSLCIYTKDQ